MFYISLPFFYENYKFNNFFKNYVNQEIKKTSSKLIDKFNIAYVHGSFPWSLWSGYNTCQGPAVYTSQMLPHITTSQSIIRLDCSNIFLQQQDFYDIHQNAILKTIIMNNHAYEISSFNLMKYISEQNINSNFIISNNAFSSYKLNESNLNLLCEQSNIDLINIGTDLSIDLSKIKHKQKIEIDITSCNICPYEKYQQCKINEQKSNYNFSQYSILQSCSYKKELINYYDLIQFYYKQGIQYFKINSYTTDLQQFNINIIKSFIKPEYQGECIDEYYKYINK